MNIIDIGCGMHKYPGSTGIDKIGLDGVDIVCDVEESGLPFRDDSIDVVYSRHFLEHVDNFEYVIKDIHRVLKLDGTANIIVPHFSNPLGYSDPTHKRFFGYYTFDYFCPEQYQGRRKVPTYYADFRFRIIDKKLEFIQYKLSRNYTLRVQKITCDVFSPCIEFQRERGREAFILSHTFKNLLSKLFNRKEIITQFYETYLAFTVPCHQTRYTLKPIK